MAKLYATLETSRGKAVSVSDNEEIVATLYDGNMKAYSVRIEWTNLGDIEEPTKGAIITTREWRNEPEERRRGEIEEATARRIQNFGEQHPRFHSKEMNAWRKREKQKVKATGKICYIEHKSGKYGGCSIPHIHD